jgi:peptide/nickel transport system substrate-binding protein
LRTSIFNLWLPALIAVIVLGACDAGDGERGAAGGDVPEEQRYGGTAVIASIGDLQSMNALTASDYNSNSIMREMLFMPLIKYDERIEPLPWLAERWDTVRVAPDTLELTFHIRRDIRWHDGQPTTAEDVAFTFERAVDPRTAFPNASGFALYAPRAELLDPYTVRFRLQPHSDFLDMWYQTSIMPRHILGDVPPAQLIQHPFGTSEPVGNGPFRFARRVPGQEWVFEANPDFPEALGGRPYLDRVVYRYIPEMTTLLTELLTGRIDAYFGVNPNQAEQVNSSPGVRLIESPFRQWVYLAWNTRRPMFQDARVRRALTMAIDRQQIVDALLYGYGEVGRGTLSPAHWSYDPNDPGTVLPYDTAQARRLLAEAGWTPGPDGILRNAQGQQFRFTMITNQGNEVRRDILEIVQAQLRQLGIIAQPRLVEWNTMNQQLQSRERNFDAVVSSWVDYFRKDDKDILHSSNLDNPFQYVGYANPRVDALIDTLGVMMNRDEARPLWREYQHLITQEAPYTPLYIPERLTGVSERLQGVQMDVRGELPTVTEWWILPSQRRAGEATGAQPGAPADTAAQTN